MTALLQRDIDYFGRGAWENPRFWERLGGAPGLFGKRALDIGCGHGSLCVDMALRGADRVVGIDIDARLIDFAREYVRAAHPELAGRLAFRCCGIDALEESAQFDVVTSKAAFEHILDLESVLAGVARRLARGGRVYVGFGPVYRSPYGDHKRTCAVIPWGHLIVPEPILLRRVSRKRARRIQSVYELGLNKLSVAEYRCLFQACGLKIVFFKVNQSRHPISRIFSLLRQVPFLSEYFAHNLYAVLERPAATVAKAELDTGSRLDVAVRG